ncbi:MAG: hypothetical protein M1825_003851 [Sarcosagium campestre]|nr:MAG: hypothetical protein M1825_003851 [Sarcosagium campestre]
MIDSALIGDPPATQDDYYIVKGMLVVAKSTKDPRQGVALPPTRPQNPSYDDEGGKVLAGLIVAITLIIVITGGRILARRWHKLSALGWDDLLIIFAAAGAVTWFSIVIAMVRQAGVGRHIYNVTYHEWYMFSRYGYIDLIVFFVTVSLTKLSIICFNWRLTGITSRTWRNVHRVFFVCVACYFLIALFWSVFRCNPPTAATSLITMGKEADRVKCLSTNVMGTTLTSLHVAFDWALLIIPIVVLIRLQTSLKTKLRCIIPLSIGGLSCVGAVMRMHYQLYPRPDTTWTFRHQLAWTTVDLTCAVTVTSLPAINSALTIYLPKSIKSTWGDSNKRSTSYGVTTTQNTLEDHGSYDPKGKGWGQIRVQNDVELANVAADKASAGSQDSTATLGLHKSAVIPFDGHKSGSS